MAKNPGIGQAEGENGAKWDSDQVGQKPVDVLGQQQIKNGHLDEGAHQRSQIVLSQFMPAGRLKKGKPSIEKIVRDDRTLNRQRVSQAGCGGNHQKACAKDDQIDQNTGSANQTESEQSADHLGTDPVSFGYSP